MGSPGARPPHPARVDVYSGAMSTPDWLSKFRALHESRKTRPFTSDEQRQHAEYKERFSRSLVAAQGLAVERDGRRTFRIGVVFQVELRSRGRSIRTATLDVSPGGFSTVADLPIETSELVEFSLKLPNSEPLTGRAKVVGKLVKESGSRMSFAFEAVAEAQLEKLETRLLDLALERLPE